MQAAAVAKMRACVAISRTVAVGRPIFRAERRTDSSPFKNFPIALFCFPIPHPSSQPLFFTTTAVFVT